MFFFTIFTCIKWIKVDGPQQTVVNQIFTNTTTTIGNLDLHSSSKLLMDHYLYPKGINYVILR